MWRHPIVQLTNGIEQFNGLLKNPHATVMQSCFFLLSVTIEEFDGFARQITQQFVKTKHVFLKADKNDQ